MRPALVGLWIVVGACSSESSELIPAEWTVTEDTAAGGEITTSSVQLPASRDIAGLLPDDPPRLVLRCLDGKVAAFIDTDPSVETGLQEGAGDPATRIDLEAAPSCE